MRFSQLIAALVALSSVSAVRPDMLDNVNSPSKIKHMLYGRQDKPESTQPPQPKSTPKDESTSHSESETTQKPSPTKDNDQPSTTGKQSESAKSGGSKSTSKPNSKTSFDDRLPAGGISMVTPAAIAGQQFYKIGDWVTFAWNYTSLSMTPSNIDILATCTANQATYTLAVNQTVQETGSILWDTGAYQSAASAGTGPPLLTEKYTLIIYDSQSSISAAAKAGYLAVFNSFTFGMYTPQPYTPWADFHCVNCNSALSAFEKLTIKALLLTCGTTIASLLYFTASFGLW